MGGVGAAVEWIVETTTAGALAAGAVMRRVRAFPASAGMMRIRKGASRAPAILLVPQDLRTSDPVRADEIIAGLHAHEGHAATTQTPFSIAPPSEDWARTMAEFSWLRHLTSAGTPEAAAAARRLVVDWMEAQGAGHPVGWRPTVTAARLRAWISASGLLLDGVDDAFYRRFSRSVWRQLRVLEAQVASIRPGAERLAVLGALTFVGLCVEGEERLTRSAMTRLARELDRQILPDGGHVSREPGVLVGLVLDLLPLRQLFSARNMTPPAAIITAVDRMTPMIRFFRHGDGSLALFNGMGPTRVDLVATLLRYDETRGAVPSSAPQSGFERLDAGGAVVLFDVGRPPASEYGLKAHAGCLSFEFSAGRRQIVINLGMPARGQARWRPEARKTAAHSTVSVADRSSARFTPQGAIVAGPRKTPVKRAGLAVTAAHDGYRRRLGVDHTRTLTLAADGERLDGEDLVEGGDQPYVIRFHLHPAARPVLIEHGGPVLIEWADAGREAWVFAADHPVTLEESVALAMPEGRRRTMQIVISAQSGETPRIRWTFRKIVRPPEATA